MIINITNKELYFSSLSSVPIATVIADADTRLILYVNSAAEELWMMKSKDMLGKQQTILHPPEWNKITKDTFSKHRDALLSGNPLGQIHNIALRSDGVEIPIDISASMINLDGKSCLIGIFTSVEKREEAYKLLASKEAELDAIIQNSQIGVMHLKNGRFLENANQRLADILGYSDAQEMQDISMEQLHLSKDRFEWFGKQHYEALRMKESTHIQYQLSKKKWRCCLGEFKW